MIKVRWLGHATFYVELGGKGFLVDPWITNPKSVAKVDDFIGKVDYIIATHDHGDHFGNAIELMKKDPKPKFVGIFEIANYVAEEIGDQSRVIDGNIGGPIDLGDGFFAVLTPALHSSNRGSPVGVVFGNNDERAYHAGDTGLSYDMKLIGELYTPKVAMLPIGGHYTMGPKEAAKAAQLIKPKYVIPMHYQTFPVIKGKPEDFEKYVKELEPDIKVVVLKPGEEVKLE
jgi:L-ascorbate metabolism protein UlaG (beta-lactamase superfamily)